MADFQYEYAVDPDIGYKGSDRCDAMYKDLLNEHHVLKRGNVSV